MSFEMAFAADPDGPKKGLLEGAAGAVAATSKAAVEIEAAPEPAGSGSTGEQGSNYQLGGSSSSSSSSTRLSGGHAALQERLAERLYEDLTPIEDSDIEEPLECTSMHVHEALMEHRGIIAAFYVMQRRRLRRVLNGRVRRKGVFNYLRWCMEVICVWTVLARLLETSVPWLLPSRHQRYIPASVTVMLILMSLFANFKFPEHIFAVWLETELAIFTMWIIWEYDPTVNGLSQNQQGLIIGACVAIAITWVIWIAYRSLLYLMMTKCCYGKHFWWNIKPGDVDAERVGHHMTYRPIFPLTLHRVEFGYQGDVDEQGRPHGVGTWFDNSFHGECLRGVWVHGRPIGTFKSREFGTGAQFSQQPIGYATSRADCQPGDLGSCALKPRRESSLRYGVAQVEVSLAGGFFPFLPSIEHHRTASSVQDMVAKLASRGGTGAIIPGSREGGGRRASDIGSIRLTVLEESEVERRSKEVCFSFDNTVTEICLPVRFCGADREGFVRASDLKQARSVVERRHEALVFVHGFNTDLACTLGKLTQILALGSMGPHIVPIVFSYAAGGLPTFFEAKRAFPDYGDDLCGFLMDLRNHFTDVHILLHSCGAEFFFANWEKIENCFGPSRHARQSQRWCAMSKAAGNQGRGEKLQLATLTMMNPDVLFEKVVAKLPGIMDYAEHLTTYNDSSDNALWGSMFAHRTAADCFQRGIRVDNTGCNTIVFGAVSETLYLTAAPHNSTPSDNGMVLRGRAVDIAEGKRPSNVPGHSFGFLGFDDSCLDVIDTSSLDQNVSKTRHGYYMLNTQMVEDVCDVIAKRMTARNRSRLVQVRGNVYKFLCPPSFLKGD
eukprot:TRINITY_DN36579_c0_g1_i1.p1 TRINITY_DN36579_c0_g1~~TRINITY_DN36579_c0_g1_i1.p1  ORF type:complete len:851 (-),score=160.53 TRINITY_DN36579_c0_g1_i1:121-2625(-)